MNKFFNEEEGTVILHMKKKSKIISLMLTLAFMVMLWPGVALAEDDTTPPEWKDNFPEAVSVSDKEFSLHVGGNEAGTAYFVRLEDGAHPPSAVQVAAGQDASGNLLSSPQAGSFHVNAVGTSSIRVRGLMPDTSYDVYAVLKDEAGNLQENPTLVEVTTTVPSGTDSGITKVESGVPGWKKVTVYVTVKNVDGIGSRGYSDADFSVKVDDTPMTFASDPPFSGFWASDSLQEPNNGLYYVVFTGNADNTEYTLTDLTVAGVVIEAGPYEIKTPPPALAAPTDLAWDDTTPGKATWGAVTDAVSYRVQLFKGVTQQGSEIKDLSGTEHDFTSAIEAAGDGIYTFRVTAIGDGTNYGNSQMSAASPEYEYTASAADTPAFAEGGTPTNNPQAAGSRQIAINFTAQEAAYYHAVFLENGADQPSKYQVKAGKDAAGNEAIKAFSSSSMAISMSIVGFVPQHSTDYDVYIVLRDVAGNLSEPYMLDFPSPPPADLLVSGYPNVGDPQLDGSKQVEVKVNLQNIDNDRKGKVYWVLLPDTAAPPSIEQVADGTDGDDQAAISSGSPEFSPGSENSFLVTGAFGSTDYYLYMVVGDTEWAYPLARCTDVVKLSVTTPADIVGEKVCKIGETEYATVQEAVEAAGSTETISLLKSFTTVQGVIIESKDITFGLNGYNLTIDTTADEGLKVTNGSVALTGDGGLNARGKLYGVYADNSTVALTNATATDTDTSGSASGMGVYAINGSKVTVHEDAAGAAHGVYAKGNGTEVTVDGDVSNAGQVHGAVYSEDQATVLVKGNVTSAQGYGVHSCSGSITVEKNVSGSHVGAKAESTGAEIYIKGDLSSASNGAVISSGSNGSITVDGVIKGSGSNPSPAICYVSINGNYIDEGVPDPENFSYLKYIIEGSDGVVWVKDSTASNYVCAIGTTGYLTLDAALAAVLENNVEPVTIKLLDDIADNDGIAIQKKKINLDLNGKTLTINNSSVETNSGVGIRAELNSDINVIGSGNLNINSNMAGLSLNQSKFITSDQITVNIIANNNAGIYADYSCIIVINGNVSGTNGIYASTDNNITVTGTATATGTGENHAVHLSGTNNTVYVGSAIVSSGNGSGVYNSSGTVTVGSESAPGKVDGKGSGIRTNSTVTVYGDVTGVSRGINASDGSTITVHGDVTSTGINGSGYGVYGFFNTTDITEKIIIDGDVIGPNGIDIHGDQSEVSVTGNVTARGTDNDDNIGVRASYAKVFVGGNVNASDCTGAYSAQASQITIDGTISATNYIKVKYGDLKAKGDNDAASTKPGYLQYSSQDAFVWVKGEQTQLPTITGTVAITGEAKLGETLTAVPTLTNSGTATYQWNRGGVAIVGATALTYELTEADITTMITVTATADGITGTGSITSAATAAVQKADGPAAPAAPTLAGKTHNSVTLTANAAYQFSKDNGLTWQDSNAFSGLSASTQYTFVAKVKATATHNESAASSGLIVTTDTKPTSGSTGNGGSLPGFAISTAGTTQEKYGAEVDIPRGAVSSDTRGDIDRFNSDKIDAPDDSFIPGNIFELTKKSSGDFLKPIIVTLPYKQSAVDFEKYDLSIYWYDEDMDEWVELDDVKIDEDDLTVSGETEETGYFALIATKKAVIPPVEPPVEPEPELPALTDISGHWAKASIEHLVEMGAISGYPDNTFRPDNLITRAEFATVLVKAMGLPISGSKVFSDTTGHWAKEAISTAYAAGIISGYNEQSFGPDDPITREQMAVMVVKAAGLTGTAPELKYADSQQISAWAREFVARAAAEKLISGYPDNTFRPANNATRAEAVTVISQKW